MAHHRFDRRLGLRRDGLGAGRPAHREHVLYGASPGRALSDARRGRYGDLRSRSGVRGIRRHQRYGDAAAPAEDDAQGGNGAARRQRLARPRHAGRPKPQRRRDRRDAARRNLFDDRRRAQLRRLSQLDRRGRRRHVEDDHRQRRQHLYAERRLVDAQRQRHPGDHAWPDAERDRAPRHRGGRLRLVRRRGRDRRRCRRSPRSTARRSARRSLPASRPPRPSRRTIRATPRSPSTAF